MCYLKLQQVKIERNSAPDSCLNFCVFLQLSRKVAGRSKIRNWYSTGIELSVLLSISQRISLAGTTCLQVTKLERNRTYCTFKSVHCPSEQCLQSFVDLIVNSKHTLKSLPHWSTKVLQWWLFSACQEHTVQSNSLLPFCSGLSTRRASSSDLVSLAVAMVIERLVGGLGCWSGHRVCMPLGPG